MVGKKNRNIQEINPAERANDVISEAKHDIKRAKCNVGNAEKTKLASGRHNRKEFRYRKW
jgi:hypothetical protein